jgi:hypothetical protein
MTRVEREVGPLIPHVKAPAITLRFASAIITRLGSGPVHLTLKIDGINVARRRVRASLAD